MARALKSLILAAGATLLAVAPWAGEVAAQSLEVLATARTNHRTASASFRIPAHQARLSELRIRSGSLAVTLDGLEIEFADGTVQRVKVQETLAPGQQSRPIPIESRRSASKVLLSLRPGLRPGETVIQLLAKVERTHRD